ncbi:MAG: MFS transporter [Actinobacteria bacterium]|nr:MFS transporter [Actinomycetota bacterium]
MRDNGVYFGKGSDSSEAATSSGGGGGLPSPAAADAPVKPAFILIPLALAQFINAYDTTAMNVAVSKVVASLGTTVTGVQTALTIYSLVMAAFMIIGSKLGDIWGRKRSFSIGVVTYGIGALITALSLNLGMMIFGWSLLEGLGSALMIPAIFALVAAVFPPGKDRIKGYAVVGSAAAAGAALGPVLMGIWATLGSWTWRCSFVSEVIVVLVVLFMERKVKKSPGPAEKPRLDILGAVLSALGLTLVVMGFLQASLYGWITTRIDVKIGNTVLIEAGGVSPVIPFIAAGFIVLGLFVLWQHRRSKEKKEPLIDLKIFDKRAAAVGLPTILVLMFMQSGLLFVAPVFLQLSLNLSPLLCGLTVLPLTVFLIIFSQLTSKLTKRFTPKSLIVTGMAFIPAGIILVWLMLNDKPSALQMIPGFIIVGIGIGLANAPLLNMVQSTVPESEQGDISGLNRAFSNLGGSLGTAVAGAVLMSVLIGTAWGLVSTSPAVEKYVPESKIEEFKAELDKDAKTMSNAQAEAYFEKVASEPEFKGIQDQVVKKLESEMEDVNQKARNKALLAALLAVGILGILGFVLSLLLPGGKAESREKQKEPAKEPAAST